jgi:hypothetical protein
MSAALEQQYRSALRWYPKRWRTRNADAAVGTLLELAHEDKRSAPAPGELSNLRMSGLGARFGFVDGVLPAAVRDRAGLIALALGTVIAVAGLVAEVTDKNRIVTELQLWPANQQPHFLVFGPFANVGAVFYLVWIVAFVATLLKLRRTRAVLLIASLPLSFVTSKVSEYLFWQHPLAVTIGWLDLLAVIALLGSFSLRGARRTLGVWTIAFGTAFALVFYAQTTEQWGVFPRADWFLTGFATIASSLGLFVVIVAAVVLWLAGRADWGQGILIVALPLLPILELAILRNTEGLSWNFVVIGVLVIMAALFIMMRRIQFSVSRVRVR